MQTNADHEVRLATHADDNSNLQRRRLGRMSEYYEISSGGAASNSGSIA